MICISIKEKTAKACLAAMAGEEFVEIRLEEMEIRKDDMEELFSRKPPVTIATCRPGAISDDERKRRLLGAIASGAAFVDVEVDASEDTVRGVAEAAKKKGCSVIVSYHNFERTPVAAELEQIVKWCFDSGADIAKIACKVNSEADAARLLGLLGGGKRLAVVGMGKKGRLVRAMAPLLGSAIAYASRARGRETAEGQMAKEELKKLMEEFGNV
ncbi:TPA: type I 3-dehydroquinate dehydratase [Candidatus Micrarchaeota archaeon]|nr:type I 3-dehydroquinate dehydratase [Candidatus Micrarchaeota archaeon]